MPLHILNLDYISCHAYAEVYATQLELLMGTHINDGTNVSNMHHMCTCMHHNLPTFTMCLHLSACAQIKQLVASASFVCISARAATYAPVNTHIESHIGLLYASLFHFAAAEICHWH